MVGASMGQSTNPPIHQSTNQLIKWVEVTVNEGTYSTPQRRYTQRSSVHYSFVLQCSRAVQSAHVTSGGRIRHLVHNPSKVNQGTQKGQKKKKRKRVLHTQCTYHVHTIVPFRGLVAHSRLGTLLSNGPPGQGTARSDPDPDPYQGGGGWWY